jgi:hypothetical protein
VGCAVVGSLPPGTNTTPLGQMPPRGGKHQEIISPPTTFTLNVLRFRPDPVRSYFGTDFGTFRFRPKFAPGGSLGGIPPSIMCRGWVSAPGQQPHPSGHNLDPSRHELHPTSASAKKLSALPPMDLVVFKFWQKTLKNRTFLHTK